MKIYTKGGDKGSTSLFGGQRVSKDHWQIEAYGTVDELNSTLGLLASYISEKKVDKEILQIQHDLFDIGSLLATPLDVDFQLPEISEDTIANLESSIDNMNTHLPILKHFILPGGAKSVAIAHICRTVCRRAERRVVAVKDEIRSPEMIIKYLNRLSDYLFVLSRYLGHLSGVEERKWIPQKEEKK